MLKSVKDLVLADHIARVIDGIPVEDSYPVVANLRTRKLIYEEWGQESGLALLLRLDQDRAWQFVQERLSRQETTYSFTILRDFFPNVNAERQMRLINYLLRPEGDLGSWEFTRVLAVIASGRFPPGFILNRIGALKSLAESKIRKWDERRAFMDTAALAETKASLASKKLEPKSTEQHGRGIRKSPGIPQPDKMSKHRTDDVNKLTHKRLGGVVR